MTVIGVAKKRWSIFCCTCVAHVLHITNVGFHRQVQDGSPSLGGRSLRSLSQLSDPSSRLADRWLRKTELDPRTWLASHGNNFVDHGFRQICRNCLRSQIGFRPDFRPKSSLFVTNWTMLPLELGNSAALWESHGLGKVILSFQQSLKHWETCCLVLEWWLVRISLGVNWSWVSTLRPGPANGSKQGTPCRH